MGEGTTSKSAPPGSSLNREKSQVGRGKDTFVFFGARLISSRVLLRQNRAHPCISEPEQR